MITGFCCASVCKPSSPLCSLHVHNIPSDYALILGSHPDVASQAGVLGLTKTVAKEFSSRNITCNAIAPGFIASDMTAKIDKKYEEAILKQIPLGTRLLRLSMMAADNAIMRLLVAVIVLCIHGSEHRGNGKLQPEAEQDHSCSFLA